MWKGGKETKPSNRTKAELLLACWHVCAECGMWRERKRIAWLNVQLCSQVLITDRVNWTAINPKCFNVEPLIISINIDLGGFSCLKIIKTSLEKTRFFFLLFALFVQLKNSTSTLSLAFFINGGNLQRKYSAIFVQFV